VFIICYSLIYRVETVNPVIVYSMIMNYAYAKHDALLINIHNDRMFMHARDHTSALHRANSTCQQSHSHTVIEGDVSPPAGVSRLSHSRSRSFTDQDVSLPAGVTRLSRSRSLSSTERRCDNQRDMVLLQHKLSDALRKLDNMKLALAAKVSAHAYQFHDIMLHRD